MKYVVTGATGFVGKHLVPHLKAGGAELLLIGRNPDGLRNSFPNCEAATYKDLPQLGQGYAALIHLAVLNNDQPHSPEAFEAVNVDLLLDTAAMAKAAGIPRFINISTVQVLDPANQSEYAKSKRKAAEALEEVAGIDVSTIYLPLVHADAWAGKLKFLNHLPPIVATPLFTMLAAAKPTVHVNKLAEYLVREHTKADKPLILSDGQENNAFYGFVSRLIDLGFALTVVLLFWWVLLLIWGLVKLESDGPGIFAQQRVGKDGKAFTCYKFRTMKQGTRQSGTHEIGADAVTPIGRFLRRTKLDELPQVWNILRSEVSLIGPRPCLPVQAQLVDARRRRGVLRSKPGISGLAQINGIDMSTPELLAAWDARYLALRSLSLDFRIALATATGQGRGDRVAETSSG